MPNSVKFAAPHLLQARLQLWRSRFMFALLFVAYFAINPLTSLLT